MNKLKGAIIGKNFTGKHEGFADTQSGTYWESLPPITGDNLRLQQALVASRSRTKRHMPPRPMPPPAPPMPDSAASPALEMLTKIERINLARKAEGLDPITRI